MKGPLGRWISRHVNLSRFIAVLVVIAIAPIAEFLWGTVLGDYIEPAEQPNRFKIYAFAPLTDSQAPILFRDVDRGLEAAKARFFPRERRWRERYEIDLVVKNTRGRPERLKGWLEHLATRSDVLASIIIEEKPVIDAVADTLAKLPFAQLYPLYTPQAGADSSAAVYRMSADGLGEAGEILTLIRALQDEGDSLLALVDGAPAGSAVSRHLEALTRRCLEPCVRLAGRYRLDNADAAIDELDQIDPDFLVADGDIDQIADFAARSRRAMRRHRYIIASQSLLARRSHQLPALTNGVILLPASGGDGRALIDDAGLPDLSYLAEDAAAIIARALEEYDDLPPELAPPLSSELLIDLLSRHSFRGRGGEYRFDADGFNMNARLLAFEPAGKSGGWQALRYQ